MKKIKFLMLSLTILAATSVFAQKDEKKNEKNELSFGIKAGINLANQTAKASGLTISTSSLLGITGGAFVNLPVSDGGFAIQPEVLYSMMGSKISFGGQSSTAELGYISVPVLAKYNIDKPGFGVYVGPQIGFLMSAKDKTGSTSTDSKSDYKSTDFSAVVGLEYSLDMGINASARYQIGLSNIAKETSNGESLKNNAFTFTIGYSF